MTSIFGIGGPQYNLEDAKVAANNLNGTFGTAVDVPSVQLLGIKYNTVNASLEGDGGITSVVSKAISATMTIRFGSVNLQTLEVITGATLSESGTTPNRVHRMKFTGENMPWFAVCGKTTAAENTTADTHFFCPKLKCTEGFEVRMEYNAFSIPEIPAMAIKDPDYTAIFEVIEHETAAAVAIPPV